MKMKKMNLNNSVQEKKGVQKFAEKFKNYVKAHYSVILLMTIGFLAASAINFFNVATGKTIASFNLEEFEVGQVADRTIQANKSIPADEMNPVFIEEGEKIIRKGFPISEDDYAKLKKMSESPMYIDIRSFANSELFLLLLMTLWFMLFAFVPFGRKILIREIIFQVVCFLVVYGMTAFGSKTQIFSSPFSIVIIIPAALFVLIEAILYGQLSAVFFSFMLSLGVFNATFFGSFNITPSCVVPFLFTLASCVSASMIVRKIERRIDMVVVSIILALIDTMMIVILSVIFNEVFNRLPVVLIGVAFNGFISGILALGFLTPVEFMLNTASVFRLMDLSDLNNPLMKKMLISASGTYNHSLMVAQLAESACREIGANALVARVGAYYHDIGKLDKSEYFVENHVAGETYDLTPALYVSVIRSHIRKGVEKAHQLHLPRQIIEIIEQHHGNSLISYFYEKAKEENPDVNPEDYSYYGNPPVSKEAAVVMIADTVEAACRSLENPTEERLEKFIQTLINAKLENKQLDCCELTFRDITKVKEVFVPILVGYHHNRIKYPNQKDPEETAEQNDADKTAENTEKSAKATKSDKTKKSKETKEVVLGDKTLDEVKKHG